MANRQVLFPSDQSSRTAREVTFPAVPLWGSMFFKNLVTTVMETSTSEFVRQEHPRCELVGRSITTPSAWLGVGDRGYDDVMIDMSIGQPFDGNAEPVITAIPNQFLKRRD